MTDYYDVQPVTKTFEYLLSGMPVIATNTSENRKVINQGNGVLIGDTAEDFYTGLKTILKNRLFFDSVKIRNNSMEYTWYNIVDKNLKIYLDQVCGN
jgi:glycosyltransferase involved in cell wall biosynthesis